MKKSTPFIHELAGGVHATVSAANLLIAYYNARRGNFLRSIIHVLVAGYEGHCFHEHWKEKGE